MDKELTRTHYIMIYVTSFIPMVMALIMFPSLPDPMPAHFGLSGDVTRWGSRYEIFLLPVISAVMGVFMAYVTKFSAKKDDHAGWMMFLVSMVTSVIFIAVTAFILYMVLSA
ncbi:MAG: DUF1648 domain-containing protein [Methanomassiliicoccaceae archaeon]|nr:DUF1648 domain-containing protein [Methanomassiliicoccaceae archaeon]